MKAIPMTYPSKAFSLVELLVVIAIIVVLLSLMAPAVDKAIRQSQIAVCLGTQHAWHTAFFSYSQSHKGSVIQYRANSLDDMYPWGEQWWDRLAPYLGYPTWGKDKTRPQGVLPPLQCPSARSQTDVYYGTATQTWLWNLPAGPADEASMRAGTAAQTGAVSTRTPGAYTLNAWMAVATGSGMPSWITRYSRAPGQAPLMGEGTWADTWCYNTEIPNGDLYYGYHDGGNLLRMQLARHGRAVNLLHLDGSAVNTPLGDLWLQHWSDDAAGRRTDNYTGDYFDRYPSDF